MQRAIMVYMVAVDVINGWQRFWDGFFMLPVIKSYSVGNTCAFKYF